MLNVYLAPTDYSPTDDIVPLWLSSLWETGPPDPGTVTAQYVVLHPRPHPTSHFRNASPFQLHPRDCTAFTVTPVYALKRSRRPLVPSTARIQC